jgi:rod shape-determining protein MreC
VTTDFLQRHKAGVLLLSFLTFSTLCLTVRFDQYVAGIKSVMWFLVSPEVTLSGKFFDKLDTLNGTLFQLSRAEGENYLLRRQNAQLSIREMEREELEKENNRLRVLLQLREQVFPDALSADVIGRDPRDWFHSLIINRGKDDGVVLSAAVVAPSLEKPTLVGRVVEMDAHSSRVLLVTDIVSAISVEIAARNEIGLLEGRNRPWVMINYLSQQSSVAAGDEVVTAGLGGVFPPGIPVGKVLDVAVTEEGFFRVAKVIPYAEFGSLKEVLVLQRMDVDKKGVSK